MKSRLLLLAGLIAGDAATAISAEHVIMVSVDGFRPAAIEQLLATGDLPNFARLQAEGVWTHNARADYDDTNTVPNHVSIVTGRAVNGASGHNYSSNGTPSPVTTLHTNKGSYVAGVFDVAHDHGLRTAFHRSKPKLIIIDQSYSATAGAEDLTGEDNGRAKVDIARYLDTDDQSAALMDLFETDLAENPVHLAFLHLLDPDRSGHRSGFETRAYLDAVRRTDAYLGRVLKLVEENEPYAGRTTLILTADHGGSGSAHTDETDPDNYTVPLYVWGADVPAAGDLYAINGTTRVDPGGERPPLNSGQQPARNNDIANLALDLLGLPSIPESTINADQDLRVAADPGPKPQLALRQLPTGAMQIRWASGAAGTVQISNRGGRWTNAPGTWPSHQGSWVDPDAPAGSRFYRVVFD